MNIIIFIKFCGMYVKDLQKLWQYCVRNEISFPANAIRIFFKNVLTPAWLWPRDVETCSFIVIIKILYCSAVTCVFILCSTTHNGMYNFKMPVYIVCKQFYFFPVPSLFPNLSPLCMFLPLQFVWLSLLSATISCLDGPQTLCWS